MPKTVMVGCGGIGRHHANVLKNMNVKLAAAADVSEQARGRFKTEFDVPAMYADFREMLDKEKPDAAFVCTPTGIHPETAIACLQAGVHVMMEKPMALTAADCRKIIKARDKAKRVLMVAFCRRFCSHWGKLKEIILSGKIGRPVYWRQMFSSGRPGSWFVDRQMGGGPFIDGCVHNYDFCLWTFGDAKRVVASIVKFREDSTALDTGVTDIEFASGDHTTLNWSWGMTEGTRGLNVQDVIGPKGAILFDAPAEKRPKDFNPEKQGAFLVILGKDQTEVAVFEKNDMYREENAHFFECIASGRKPCVGGEDGLKATELACEVFAKAGRKD